ncbi:MAG: class I SAM-dependent methyltransferase [Anaerolineae bacterium]
MEKKATLTYSNWVSTKFIIIPLVMGALFLGLTLIWPGFAILVALCLLGSVYFVYARHAFSPRGGHIQAKLWDVVLDRLDWDGRGKALDIGCGNGPLTIALAQRHPDAHVTGIDTWGKAWDYAKAACERNAEAAGVAGRTDFQKASASDLPFEDGAFDAAISNFVFHDVSDTMDKRALVREALRVVKKGGRFVFHDYFAVKAMYGELDDLLETIKSWGIAEVAFVDTSTSDFIPAALKLPFMLGNISLIYGTK